jgi:MoaA/NifB/PqqE/SkfB family radical SAM enzyme
MALRNLLTRWRERHAPAAVPDALANVRAAMGDEPRLLEALKAVPRQALDALFAGDRLEDNYLLNCWEYANGAITLESLPWHIHLPIADSCNARCEFCTSWLTHGYFMKPEALDRLSEVLATARVVALCGYGEPLANPDFGAIVTALERYVDKRCHTVLFTNGALLERWVDRLLDLNVGTVDISLNAATAGMHDAVMGLGPKSFDRVLAGIRVLADRAAQRQRNVSIDVTFVVTSTSLPETAAFIRLANELPVRAVYLRTLQRMSESEAFGPLNYFSLPPYLRDDFERHRQEAIEAIAASRITIYASPESWDVPVFPPDIDAKVRAGGIPVRSRAEIGKTRFDYSAPKPAPPSDIAPDFNPFGRRPRFNCSYPYQYLLLNRQTQQFLTPCCFMNVVPTMDPIMLEDLPFRAVWNGPQFTHIRRTLVEGPLIANCRVCPENK